jgi:hypothetical protein
MFSTKRRHRGRQKNSLSVVQGAPVEVKINVESTEITVISDSNIRVMKKILNIIKHRIVQTLATSALSHLFSGETVSVCHVTGVRNTLDGSLDERVKYALKVNYILLIHMQLFL